MLHHFWYCLLWAFESKKRKSLFVCLFECMRLKRKSDLKYGYFNRILRPRFVCDNLKDNVAVECTLYCVTMLHCNIMYTVFFNISHRFLSHSENSIFVTLYCFCIKVIWCGRYRKNNLYLSGKWNECPNLQHLIDY